MRNCTRRGVGEGVVQLVIFDPLRKPVDQLRPVGTGTDISKEVPPNGAWNATGIGGLDTIVGADNAGSVQLNDPVRDGVELLRRQTVEERGQHAGGGVEWHCTETRDGALM